MLVEEIILAKDGVIAKVAPARGGIVTALNVRGKDVLYLDRATLEDPAKNVRGGIPILFPFAGKLEGDHFLPADTRIKQHGFARNKAWSVTEQSADRLSMRVTSDAETLITYPYACELEQVCSLLPNGLEIELRVKNTGECSMPVAPGWHPYFPCPSVQKPEVQAEVSGINPTLFSPDKEFEFGADAPVSGSSIFEIPGLGNLKLGWSDKLRHLHFWSLPGADFVCIEPFTGDLGAVNRPGERVDIAPGETRVFKMRVEL